MDYTKGFKTATSKIGLDINERAMADLILAGWKEQDAYVMCFGMNPAYNDNWHKKKIQELISRKEFAKYSMKNMNKEQKQDVFIDKAKMSKEEVMDELLQTAFSLPKNDPKRADILMKYADLDGMKREDAKREDKTVHTYLPLTCRKGSLYQKSKNSK